MTTDPQAGGTLIERLREYAADCDEGIVSDYETPGAIAREAAQELTASQERERELRLERDRANKFLDGMSAEAAKYKRWHAEVGAGQAKTIKRLNETIVRATEAESALAAAQREIDERGDAYAILDNLHRAAIIQCETSDAELTALRAEAEGMRAKLKGEQAHSEMIANAWQREICQEGFTFRNKTHWIDFMVLATRDITALAKENGVKCCGNPELCTNLNCNNLLRHRLAPEYRVMHEATIDAARKAGG